MNQDMMIPFSHSVFIKICQNTLQLCWGDEWPTLSPGWERVRVRGK